jgi:two-component sensor histidine kinase
MTDPGSQSEVNERESQMLYVRELLHRISNEYTNAISFTHSLAARSSSKETKSAVEKVAQHLHALAESHCALSPPNGDGWTDFADNLSELCRVMTSAWLAPERIALQLAVRGPIPLRKRSCWRACLIVSELIRNAQRHASFSEQARVVVSMDVVAGRVLCRVSDNGSAAMTYVPGTGTQLIDALAGELEGAIERQFGESGASVLLSFPTGPVLFDERAGAGAGHELRDCKFSR